MKCVVLFFCLTGVMLSQTITPEEHQQVKDALVEISVRWNEVIKYNKSLTDMTDVFVQELQAIKNPSEELIVIMKKYNIYKDPNGN